MPVIHMETEQVRAVADTMRVAAARMGDLHGSLNMQVQQLQSAWQGGGAADFHREVQLLSRQLDQHIRALDVLSGRVHAEVTEWESVDGVASTAASSTIAFAETTTSTVSGWGAWLDSDKIEAALTLTGGVLTASHVSWRKGELIFRGKNWFHDLADLPEHLRHVKVRNLPKSFVKSAFKIDKVDKSLLVLELAERYSNSWANYNRNSDRLAAAAMDTLFVGAKVVAARAGQAAIMSLLGGAVLGAVATVGAPASVVVGTGVLLWWGSGLAINWFADRAYDAFESSGWKDKIVHGTGNFIESSMQAAGQVVAGSIQAANDFIQWNISVAQKAAQMVDSGFRRAIGNIAFAFD